MTDKKSEPQPFIAEVLIATASKMAQEQGVKLIELMGHMEIAKLEVFNRNLRAAEQSKSQPSGPAEGGDKENEAASSPAEGEDKA